MAGTRSRIRYRYGIAEWYGRSFVHLAVAERQALAAAQGRNEERHACPWRTRPGTLVSCNKKGGVCSLRLYQEDTESGVVTTVPVESGQICVTCPHRFNEDDLAFRWIGSILLGREQPIVLSEIGFLEREISDKAARPGSTVGGDVGKIDNVLVHPKPEPLSWCAVEVQAVYFSGASMSREFAVLKKHNAKGLPFPAGQRRPDFRSSGPKRLMPQLQIKVPALRRWGKKMAVLVDRAFFGAFGAMDDVSDLSNCDIAWFVVQFHERRDRLQLVPDFVRFTTLERAVEGLTAGIPVSLETFERRIREKLRR